MEPTREQLVELKDKISAKLSKATETKGQVEQIKNQLKELINDESIDVNDLSSVKEYNSSNAEKRDTLQKKLQDDYLDVKARFEAL